MIVIKNKVQLLNKKIMITRIRIINTLK